MAAVFFKSIGLVTSEIKYCSVVLFSESPPPVLRRSISRTRSTSPRKSISRIDDDYTGKPTYLYGTGVLISMIVIVDDYTGKPTYLYGTGELGG